MKRFFVTILAVVLTVFVFVGCEKNYVPDPEVEQYLNTGLNADKAFAKISDCSYRSKLTLSNKQGEVMGEQTDEVTFDVSDKDSLSLVIKQTFTGRYVVNGVTKQTVTLQKQDGSYLYKTVADAESQNKQQTVDAEFANDLITSLVYSDNGVYSDGGLYYGDVFMLKIYKYPAESFYVDKENNLCVFDEKMRIKRDGEGDVLLYQTTKINADGLLVYDFEKYESQEKDYVLVSELFAEYGYKQQ